MPAWRCMSLPATTRLKDGRSVVVRRAEPRDAETWVENVNQIGAERVFLMTETLRPSVGQVTKQFADADPAKELWICAELEGRVVGGANFLRGTHAKNAHVAELGVAIVKPVRGLGIGEALMRAGIAWAKSVGVTRLKLGVFATNDRAIALYRKLGFVEEGRLRGEVVLDGTPVDELLMALRW